MRYIVCFLSSMGIESFRHINHTYQWVKSFHPSQCIILRYILQINYFIHKFVSNFYVKVRCFLGKNQLIKSITVILVQKPVICINTIGFFHLNFATINTKSNVKTYRYAKSNFK